jgi:hypothetical protein
MNSARSSRRRLDSPARRIYKDAAQVAKEKDLDPLRGRDDFKKLLQTLKQANDKKSAGKDK